MRFWIYFVALISILSLYGQAPSTVTGTIRVAYWDGDPAPDYGVEYDYYKTDSLLAFLDFEERTDVEYSWDAATGDSNTARLTATFPGEPSDTTLYTYVTPSSGTVTYGDGSTGTFVTYDASWDLDYDGTPDGEQIDAGNLPTYTHMIDLNSDTDGDGIILSLEGLSNTNPNQIDPEIWLQLGSDIYGEFAGDRFGSSISTSSNGNRIAVGAVMNDGNGPTSGHVRVFDYNDGSWAQAGSDIVGENEGDHSGASVALSADGNIVAIGATFNDGGGSGSGHVRIFQFDGTEWQQIGNDIDGSSSGARTGYSIDLNDDGTRLVVGSYWRSGSLSVYDYNGQEWELIDNTITGDQSSEQLGYWVSISGNGNVVAAGAPQYNSGDGRIKIFQIDNNSLSQLGASIVGSASEQLQTVSLNDNGTRIATGSRNHDFNGSFSGKVAIYEYNGGLWSQVKQSIFGDEGDLAFNVDLLGDGSKVAIGGRDFVNVYKESETEWQLTGQKIRSMAGGEIELSGDGNKIVIPEEYGDANGLYDRGVVRVYQLVSLMDSDGDGLTDQEEQNIYGSDPLDVDSDKDSIMDGIEVRYSIFGFDPTVNSSAALAAFQQAAAELPGVLTDAQRHGLSLGGISLTPSGGNTLSVDFIIEESEDLSSWTTVDTVSHSLDASDTKKFIRVRKPE